MLSVNPRLTGAVMIVRPSMVKFPSENTENLEICDTANKPIPLVLNRQMIKILEDMGMPNDWFLQQQKRELYKLQLITAHISNTSHFLTRQRIADRIGFPQLLNRLDTLNIDYRGDRFLCSVVEATVLNELRLLKHKARILIPQGVTLFGIMDETGYLEEGEVYVAFDKASFIEGHSEDFDNRKMIITRSPALHPGDIQLATNIVPPDYHPLRTLKNCIVFSQKGKRDLPSCLSGGDLDGDIYGIIWDPKAVSGCKQVFEPADYPRTDPININREVTKEDMTEFFIKFMATDKLGMIAVKHMVVADQRPDGTTDPDCIILAEMHSTGVDYSKTGIPVDMSKLMNIKGDKYRPDFLAPAPLTHIQDRSTIVFDAPNAPVADEDDDDTISAPSFQYYYSEKILGRLYREIDEKKIWFENIKIPYQKPGTVWYTLLDYIVSECKATVGDLDWKSWMPEARDIRDLYEGSVWDTTQEYSDHASMGLTELEVFTGAIFSQSGVQSRRQRDKSVELKDAFDRIAQFTVSLIRKPETTDDDELYPGLMLSIACLAVGNTEPQYKGNRFGRTEDEFHSFKILAACCAIRELDAAIRDLGKHIGGISLA